MYSPIVVILLNSVCRFVRIRGRFIWIFKLQNSHVEHGNPLMPRILSWRFWCPRVQASNHNHLPCLCSMACGPYPKGRRCIICSKPAKGGQGEHIHLFSVLVMNFVQCSLIKLYSNPSINDSISTNFVSLQTCKIKTKTYISKLVWFIPWTPTAQNQPLGGGVSPSAIW